MESLKIKITFQDHDTLKEHGAEIEVTLPSTISESIDGMEQLLVGNTLTVMRKSLPYHLEEVSKKSGVKRKSRKA